jgi:replicative DNA helicase
LKDLPHSEETERAVLGAILLDPSITEEVTSQLSVSAFYVERHRIVYKAMFALHTEEPPQVIDFRTLQVKLERSGQFEAAGGISFLALMDLDLPDIGRIESYVNILKNLAAKRVLVQVAGALDTMARNGVSPNEAVACAIEDLEDIQNGSTSRGGWISFSDVNDVVAVKLEEDGYAHASLPTGLPDLDRIAGGMPIGKMVVLAARPGCGKSSELLQIIEHNACRVEPVERVPCAILNLEMTNEETVLRMIARRTGLSFQRLQRGSFSGDEWSKITRAQVAIRDSSIWLEESVFGVSEIIAAIKKLRRKHGVQLVGLDYLGLMKTSDLETKENRTNQIAEISRRLFEFAKKEGVTVLTAYQLNRVSVERKDQRPDLHHLAESAALERDASQVYMNWMELDARGVMTGNAEILVRKNRNGPLGVVECLFDGPRMLFTCKENRRYP